MIVALHGLATKHCTLLTDIRIAKETGYQGIEIVGSKLRRYLDTGHRLDRLLPQFEGLPPVGLGYIQDVERQDPEEFAALLRECEDICALAEQIGGPMVQLLTGPLDPAGPYKGIGDRPWPEVRALTAKNLRAIADIGQKHRVRFFLEPLTFAHLHTLGQALEVIDAAERSNVGLVIDFWHLWDSGTTPDDIARLDKKVIFCAHFCDSLEANGERGGPDQRGRDVWTGAGRIPLKEWVDAVRATGFDGWWSCELLSPKYWELDPWTTARDLREYFVRYMLV
jgi:sugar phosphate isomerase/epimerase